MITVETPRDFVVWLEEAKPGDKALYWEGHLAVDRESIVFEGNKIVSLPIDPAHSMGQVSYLYYQLGFVELVQVRGEPGVCLYIAQRRRVVSPVISKGE